MATQTQQRMTVAEYLALERLAETRSEFLDGEVFAMSGASAVHVTIVSNIVIALGTQLKKRDCRVFSSDLRVKIPATGLFTYPDVVVACGELRFAAEDPDTLTNPKLLVEVLSKSTEDYDRGRKFEHYRTIDSFVEYILVAQDKCHVEQFVRQPDGRWLFYETNRIDDRLTSSLGCELLLADVYDKVELSV